MSNDAIPSEYLNTPDHPFPLCDFAETVTPESLPYLLMRLSDESKNGEYQITILGEAARTLDRPTGEVWREFRNCQKPNKKNEPQPIELTEAVISEGDFLSLEIKQRPIILFPWLKKGDLVMITAPRGIGKSMLVDALLTAITRGLSIGTWKTENPVDSLLVDGEMASDNLQQRHRRFTQNLSEPLARLDIMSADLMHQKGFPTPNLANAEWREALYKFLASSDYGLIVIDNVAALSPGLDENSKQDWDPLNQFFLSIRFLGIAVILIHHSGKDPKKTSQRGTSSHEDALDTSITLKQSPGYKTTDGCRFVVEFTKSRSVCGDGIRPFVFSIEDQEDGTVKWRIENKSFDPNAIIALLGKGIQQKEIPVILGIDKATVSKIKTRAVADDMIEEGTRGKCYFTAKGKRVLGNFDIAPLLSR